MQTLFFESLFGNLNYIPFYVEWFLGYYPFLADSLNFRVKQEGDWSNFCFLFIHLLVAIITVVYILINYTISRNETERFYLPLLVHVLLFLLLIIAVVWISNEIKKW